MREDQTTFAQPLPFMLSPKTKHRFIYTCCPGPSSDGACSQALQDPLHTQAQDIDLDSSQNLHYLDRCESCPNYFLNQTVQRESYKLPAKKTTVPIATTSPARTRG